MMGLKIKLGASTFWVSVITAGILACLGGVFYTFFMIQEEAGQAGEYRSVANELRVVTQKIAVKARETEQAQQNSFRGLQGYIATFDQLTAQLSGIGVDAELQSIEEQWVPVRDAARKLIDAAPTIVAINGVSRAWEDNIKPVQGKFAEAVDILSDEGASAGTVAAVQKTLWLTERIARNMDKIIAGGAGSQAAAVEFRADAANVVQIVDALGKGDSAMGVDRVSDRDALAAVAAGAELFSVVSAAIDQVADASAELSQAASARQTVVESTALLAGPVSYLAPSLERLGNARSFDRGSVMFLLGAPALLAVGLLVVMYRVQRRRVLYTEQGVAEINGALVKIAEGDLTVQVPEDNSVTCDIAREINASTGRQRELIRNIRTPFVVSVEEINKIGKSARGQVAKGKELTRSVGESATAATEMVRSSDEIKSSTVRAAQTSQQNRQQVAQGYDLTKDMSKASADVRESVQKTSKSAKRQGELIQSVTTAAEYIQALNTKISVVAINTRIEAEKAGEYGRPFLGIAEAIGDLMREAEEEGRKVISEVRMLQDMSAENLSSMENTVGTVVSILEYIDRLHSSLEEINVGSDAISSLINTVDDAAGQSADSAQHMNATMVRIRERNLEISEFSEFTQVGVSALQKSMRNVAENLSQFKIGEQTPAESYGRSGLEQLAPVSAATQIYGEREMSAMEVAPPSDSKVSG